MGAHFPFNVGAPTTDPTHIGEIWDGQQTIQCHYRGYDELV